MGQFKTRRFHFDRLWSEVAEIATENAALRKLGQSVLELSDIYTSGAGSPAIWKNPELQKAYLAYFFPLNSVRLHRALEMLPMQDLLQNCTHAIELGSGPGTAHLTFQATGHSVPWFAIEEGAEARQWHSRICERMNFPAPTFTTEPNAVDTALGVFSYVLTETALPAWAYKCRSLLIIEPSMRNASRSLMQLRQHLIDGGFEILGPCTHQEGCPLLLHTNKDWCHFRVHLEKPDYFSALEQFLPMRNDSLTFSFIAARKSEDGKRRLPLDQGRVIGELMPEKGKKRIGFCRSSKKEQLSWLDREGEVAIPESGSLFQLPEDAKNLGSEIRLPVTKTD